jgi:hypothetical protein
MWERRERLTGKGNRNELGGGRAVPEDDGMVDYLPGGQTSWGTSVSGLRAKSRHRGPATSPCHLVDPGALHGGGFNATTLCC